jgi:hypothetical protein
MLGYLKSVGKVSVKDMIFFAAINKDLFDIVGRENGETARTKILSTCSFDTPP